MRGELCSVSVVAVLIAALGIGVDGAAGAGSVQVYDTRESSPMPYTPVGMSARQGWSELLPSAADYPFHGDAVMLNDSLALVVRPGSTGAELYSRGKGGAKQRASLIPLRGERTGTLTHANLQEGESGAPVIEGIFETSTGESLRIRFKIEAGSMQLRLAPEEGVTGIRVEAPCRYVAFPRSDGAGSVVFAGAVSDSLSTVTGNGYMLQMLGRGDSILMTQWKPSDQNVGLNVRGIGETRMIQYSAVSIESGEAIAVSVWEDATAWREVKGAEGESASLTYRWPDAPWQAGGGTVKMSTRATGVASTAADPFVRLFDTGTPSPKALEGRAIRSKSDWTEVPADTAEHAFTGDAVCMNDRLAIAFRRQGVGVEIYTLSSHGDEIQGAFVPLANGRTGTTLQSLSIEKNAHDAARLKAAYVTNDAGPEAGIHCELAVGQAFVKTTPLAGTTTLRVSAACRFAVMPDFFASDINVDAHDYPPGRVQIPSENILLQLLGSGDAILMSVWSERDQDIAIKMAREDVHTRIESVDIDYGKDGAIWIAALADKGIWHMHEVSPADSGREIALNWKWPYPALWRVDWRRTEGVTDSWEMLTQNPDGGYRKHGLFEENENAWTEGDWWGGGHPRTRITPALGRFHFPCWVDKTGQGFLEPLKLQPQKKQITFSGPALIYPLNRLAGTPPDKYTVVDLLRNSLGVGPCEYILDIEGQDEAFEGLPTCTVRDIINEIYEKNQQRDRRQDIERALKDVLDFIRLIRGRIDKYVAFAREMDAYLVNQASAEPRQSALIEELRALNQELVDAYETRREGIRSPEEAAALVDDFRKSVLNDTSPGALRKCKEFTEAWVGIGGNQDELVAECRLAVKLLRQRAALAMATDPAAVNVATVIRERTHEVLRDPVNYEAAHY
jgi:hypothetical protein